jgi:hypothetical protein
MSLKMNLDGRFKPGHDGIWVGYIADWYDALSLPACVHTRRHFSTPDGHGVQMRRFTVSVAAVLPNAIRSGGKGGSGATSFGHA